MFQELDKFLENNSITCIWFFIFELFGIILFVYFLQNFVEFQCCSAVWDSSSKLLLDERRLHLVPSDWSSSVFCQLIERPSLFSTFRDFVVVWRYGVVTCLGLLGHVPVDIELPAQPGCQARASSCSCRYEVSVSVKCHHEVSELSPLCSFADSQWAVRHLNRYKTFLNVHNGKTVN